MNELVKTVANPDHTHSLTAEGQAKQEAALKAAEANKQEAPKE